VTLLIVRARLWLCALPIAAVAETLRALPLRELAGAPRFVRGISVVRGLPVPVIDLAALLGAGDDARGARLVSLRAGGRSVALEVDEVLGVRRLEGAAFESTPPLLSSAMPACMQHLGALDGQMLAVLEATRLVPEDVWTTLQEAT
jgi:purine-binding chemotaxis protein CheW